MTVKTRQEREKKLKVQRFLRQGRLPEAMSLLERLSSIGTQDAEVWYLLGTLYEHSQKLPDAERCYATAVSLRPDDSKAHFRLGSVLQDSGQNAKAITSYQNALKLDPENTDTLGNLGVCLLEAGELEASRSVLERAIARQSGNHGLHYSLGNTLLAMKLYAGARDSFKRCIQLSPNFVDAHNNLGLTILEMGDTEDAISIFKQTVSVNSAYPMAYLNLGNAYARLGELEEAKRWYAQAVKHGISPADTEYNLGNLYARLNHKNDAIRHFREAIRINPNHVQAHWNLSYALLGAGNYSEGWVEYEWRWKRPGTVRRSYSGIEWDGKPIPGKTLLLYAEQGFGDTIQFIRYARLAREHAGKILVECPKELLKLLILADGVDFCCEKDSALPPYDLNVPIMSLPRIFGTLPETIPARIPYLKAPLETRTGIAEKVSRKPGTTNIGIVWTGRSTRPTGVERSCSFQQLARLAQIDGVQLFSLQVGSQSLSNDPNKEGVNIIDLAPLLGDFADTAAAIMQLDLIISIDTATAHLAGALGRPVWVLLASVPDWRWMLDIHKTPWYPTMRLFRQTKPDVWDDVIDRIATLVSDMLETA